MSPRPAGTPSGCRRRTRSQSGDKPTRPNVTLLRNLLLSLDETAQPVEVFFRDDDAGWEDERLLELIARFAEHGLPLDLAVIPAELTPALAGRLAETHVGMHQHGYAHTNHQVEGRKCEFGPARGYREQRADIARGWARLRELLGDRIDPFFTPPWNRCTRDTGEALVELAFDAALARAPRRAARAAAGAPGPPRRRAAVARPSSTSASRRTCARAARSA